MNIRNKSLSVAIKLAHSSKTDGTPSAEQLALINQYTLKDHEAAELYVRQFIVAHTALDRDKEIIADGLLQSMSDTLAGKGFFVKHPTSYDGDSGPGIGKWFECEVKTFSLDAARELLGDVEFAPMATSAKILFASAYVPRTTKHADTIADIDAGVASFVSASFSYSDYSPIEVDGDVMGYLLSGKGEAREASLVWLGAQPGARAVKSAQQSNTPEDDSMDPKELQAKNKTLEGEKTALQTQLDSEKSAKEAAESKLKTFTDVLGDHSPTDIKAAIDEQAKAKSALVDSLVAFDRNSKKCGDDEAAIKAATDKYNAYPAAALADLDAANKAAQGKGIGGGDVNHSNKDAGDSKIDDCPI